MIGKPDKPYLIFGYAGTFFIYIFDCTFID